MAEPSATTTAPLDDRVGVMAGLLRHLLGTGPVRAEPAERIPAEQFVELAGQLGLIRPLYRALSTADDTPACREWRAAMKRPHLIQTARTVKALEDSRAVVNALQSKGVDHIPFKGSFLAMDLFGDPDARATSDIDIILPGGRADIDRAVEALACVGYEAPRASAVVLDYYARECREFTLTAPGKLAVDLHYGSYPDLPDGAFARAASRSIEVDTCGIARRRFLFADTLAILATHYWGVARGTRLKWLLDIAVLVGSPETFAGDWLELLEEWRAGFIVAAVLAGVGRDLGVGAPREARGRLLKSLDARERAVCRRVERSGPEGVPFGLVQKVHRLRLPLKARYRAVRKYLFPHPGRIALDSQRPEWTPGMVDRLGHAAKRLRSALRVG
jgi:hypothetical protein